MSSGDVSYPQLPSQKAKVVHQLQGVQRFFEWLQGGFDSGTAEWHVATNLVAQIRTLDALVRRGGSMPNADITKEEVAQHVENIRGILSKSKIFS